MSNYLMLDDRRIELSAELAEMLAQAVKQEPEKVDPFARTAVCNLYYYIDCKGDVNWTHEAFEQIDSENYAVANYCTDKELMEQRSLHEALNRLLWRYSEQHGGDHLRNDVEVNHYLIYWDLMNYKWRVTSIAICKELGVVYFKDAQTAQNAIDEIVMPFVEAHPEFRW